MTKQKVMALGFFDGIHVGHAALINKIKQRAEETGAEPAVLTFDVSLLSTLTSASCIWIGRISLTSLLTR